MANTAGCTPLPKSTREGVRTTAADHNHARLAAHVQRLAADLDELTTAWDAVDEVDSNLGTDVENVGRRVVCLLDDLRAHIIATDALRASQLLRYILDLEDAVNDYAELDEHDTNASIDIFDRLAPGIALAQRNLQVLADPQAARRITVGELIELLRQFPHHVHVWVADPSSTDGYTPLDGTAGLGHDHDPAAGDPETFVILGYEDRPVTTHVGLFSGIGRRAAAQ